VSPDYIPAVGLGAIVGCAVTTAAYLATMLGGQRIAPRSPSSCGCCTVYLLKKGAGFSAWARLTKPGAIIPVDDLDVFRPMVYHTCGGRKPKRLPQAQVES